MNVDMNMDRPIFLNVFFLIAFLTKKDVYTFQRIHQSQQTDRKISLLFTKIDLAYHAQLIDKSLHSKLTFCPVQFDSNAIQTHSQNHDR